jgi:Zn-dependent protease with chaperone function
MNAFAMGVGGRGTVVLQTGLLDAMKKDEILFVIGHELGHLAAGHTRMIVVRGVPDAGVGLPLITPILGWLFSFWQRKTEYTADRAGLLACQDLRAALRALVKLAVGPRLAEQINIDELVQQTREAAADTSARFAETLASHPFLLKRIDALIQFWNSTQYRRLIEDTSAGYAGPADQHEAGLPV